ncbi:hypothetical protein [Magnetococcus sp. PR-3]|uniref:hypothetical protein n=1 Tax=Magnetococcus sp. PR-3 TaxID=3120355 RepID=UPI002FCE5267
MPWQPVCLLIWLIYSLLPGQLHAKPLNSAVCVGIEPPIIEIIPVPVKAVQAQRLSREQIAKRAGRKHLRGYTHTQFFYAPRYLYGMATQPDQQICLYVAKLALTIGYHKTEILVEDRYPPNSCNSLVVKAHEHQHVDIYNRALSQALTGLKLALTERLGQLIIRAPKATLHTQQKQIEKLIKQYVNQASMGIIHEARRLNGQIDTLKSFQKLHQQCENW